MDPEPSKLRRLPANVWVLSATSFFTDVSSEMLFNLIPLFLVNVLGTRTLYVGLIDGIAETTASLVKIISGRLSDVLGKRKWLTVAGYGLSAIAKPFLYFAKSWPWVLGVRFTDRIGKGVRTAPRDALLANSIQSDQRGLAFGLHRAGDTAGAFTGLGIAALIVWLAQSNEAVLEQSTFRVVVLASIIPAVLGVLILAFGAREVPAPKEVESTVQPNTPGTQIKTQNKLTDHRFKLFLIVVVIFTLGNSSDSFIILRAQDRGLNVLQEMLMLMTFNAVYALLSGPLGSLSDRIGRRSLILGGWLLYGLIYLGFALSRTGAQMWVLFALYGIYYASTEGIAKALVADLVGHEQRGTAYGFFNAAIGITALPASVIAGVLWQGVGSWGGFGSAAPFFFGASMALLAGVLFWSWVR